VKQNVILLILIGILFSVFSFAQRPGKANTDNISRKWSDINYAGDTLTGLR